MTSYQLCQAWLPIIAIVLISLYQLLIYLSLVSANTSLSLCQHFIFHLCQHFIFHLRGQVGCQDQNQGKFQMANIYTGLYGIYTTLHSTGSILHTTGRISIELKINKVSFLAKVKHWHKKISKVSFVYVYSASCIG